jgi:hypothetical protein
MSPSFNQSPQNHSKHPSKIKKQAHSPLSSFSTIRMPTPGPSDLPHTMAAPKTFHPKTIAAASAISPVTPQASWTAPEPTGGDKPTQMTHASINTAKTALKSLRARQTLDGINPCPGFEKTANRPASARTSRNRPGNPKPAPKPEFMPILGTYMPIVGIKPRLLPVRGPF